MASGLVLSTLLRFLFCCWVAVVVSFIVALIFQSRTKRADASLSNGLMSALSLTLHRSQDRWRFGLILLVCLFVADAIDLSILVATRLGCLVLCLFSTR